MFSEEGMTDSPLESPIMSPEPQDINQCPTCSEKMKQPLVLACLHVYCQSCLQKQVDEKNSEGSVCTSVQCEKCKQESSLSAKGLADLTPEFVLLDMMEMSDIKDMQIICTSCKAKEKAVARCQDCSNFLCPNCVTAHQFMRCFEKHKVITFEEMKSGTSTTHKPIFCTVHPSENLKLFCKSCEVAICNDCVTSEHKAPLHQVERVGDREEMERDFYLGLIGNSKAKITSLGEASDSITNALGELQSQRDNAKDLINETFQSYKVILEKRKDELLAELDTLQSSKELNLMDMCHNVEKATEQLEDGTNFIEHIINNGSVLHLILMKKLIASQLQSLVNDSPNPEVNVAIEFQTDLGRFEEAMKNSFGSFKKDEPKVPERPSSSLHSSFETEGFNLQMGILSPDTTVMPPLQPDFMHQMPPVSMPSPLPDVNFQSLANIQHPSMMPISRSRSTVESRSLSRNSHSPAISDSGISMDGGSTNSGSSAPLVNIAALAKLGTVGYSTQGMAGLNDTMSPAAATASTATPGNSQLTLNGQIVPGLNMGNITGMPPVSGATSTPSSSDGSWTPWTGRARTPNLDTLAGLLNQNNPAILDGGTMNNIGNFSVGATGSGNITPSHGSITPSALSDSSSSIGTVSSSQGSGFMNINSGPPVRRSNKMSAMQIRVKFGMLGPGKGQFNSPHGFCLGCDEVIIVADTNNHRIQVFEKSGEFCYQFGIPGREEGQMWYPRKVAVMRHLRKVIVCDRGNERSRMQMFTMTGQFVKKIAIRYIDIVAGLAISEKGHIVAVDSVSPTVFCIAETGELVKWFDCSDYMREPSDIAISGKEYFVCDFKGHCVVVFNEEGHFQRRIGCENITNYPNGIDISDAGDVLVGDSHGNRFHVAVFQRDGSLIGEFECPYVKVSRCCGLKITSDGYVVTLAKNNHHVLVLNTLYIS